MDELLLIRQRGKVVCYGPGEQVYSKGEPAEYVFVICSGELVTTAMGPDGREVTIYRMNEGYRIGPITALVPGSFYDTDCRSVANSKVIATKTEKVRELVRQHHTLAVYLLDLSLRRLSRRTRKWEDSSLLPGGALICKWLLEYESERPPSTNGEALLLSMSDRAIGHLLGGMSRETVSRYLLALSRMGVIQKSERSIRILDRKRLLSLASGAEAFPVSAPRRSD